MFYSKINILHIVELYKNNFNKLIVQNTWDKCKEYVIIEKTLIIKQVLKVCS